MNLKEFKEVVSKCLDNSLEVLASTEPNDSSFDYRLGYLAGIDFISRVLENVN